MLLPYTAGRLVARVHDDGEVLSTEHTEDGTRLHARVGRRAGRRAQRRRARLTPPGDVPTDRDDRD